MLGKNNLSGAAFNLIGFKMFSEGLSFPCVNVWCGQMEDGFGKGYFMMFYSTLPQEVQYSGPVKTITPFSLDFKMCGVSPFPRQIVPKHIFL